MLRAVFWLSASALGWTQVGYGAALALLARRFEDATVARDDGDVPRVSLIVAAYKEADVIADKVADARALDWPADRLEVIVAVDGSDPKTLERAARADRVLALPRTGKVRAQDAGVDAATGDLLAFSDANARWEPGALRALVAPFADLATGYVCGRVDFVDQGGTNQEGIYWRYELWQRERESRLHSVTAGNGAIYAVRPAAYLRVDERVSHDLSLPFALVKRGWRARYAPAARATEKMVPTLEGEWARKRRMMSHAWPMIARGGLLDPRGYPPRYALMVFSHRALRYASPFLHVALALATLGLLRAGRVYRLAALAQAALLAAALAGGRTNARPALLARYYVLTTAAVAAGLLDWLRRGTPPGWEPAEGTR